MLLATKKHQKMITINRRQDRLASTDIQPLRGWMVSREIHRGGAETAETNAERAAALRLSQRSLRRCGEASSSSLVLNFLWDACFKNGKLFFYASLKGA